MHYFVHPCIFKRQVHFQNIAHNLLRISGAGANPNSMAKVLKFFSVHIFARIILYTCEVLELTIWNHGVELQFLLVCFLPFKFLFSLEGSITSVNFSIFTYHNIIGTRLALA